MTTTYEGALRHREIAPISHQNWARQKEDESALLEQRYSQWVASIEGSEGNFKRFVYENPEAGELDFRQHRQVLYLLLAIGEEIAVDFLILKGADAERGQPYVALLDEKLDALRSVLRAWHGPIEEQKDIPETFKKGVRDLADRRMVSMESALGDEAPTASVG